MEGVDDKGEVPALVRTEFMPRARSLAEWAHRETCKCAGNADPDRKVAGCVDCLVVVIGHAMTEAAVPLAERERVIASGEALECDPSKDEGN